MDERPYRVGLLVPSSNTVMEPDFVRELPADVTVHSARMLLRDVTVEAEEVMLDDHALPAAEALGTLQPDVTVFGCTSAGALLGHAAELALTKRISLAAGSPVITVIQAIRGTLQRFGARRVGVVTPYSDVVTQRVVDSIADMVDVVAVANLGLVDNRVIGDTPPSHIAEFVVSRLGSAGADAVFISCTNFRAVEALGQISAALGVPVTSSNAAAIDAVLRHREQALQVAE
jgi:maleate isomerase